MRIMYILIKQSQSLNPYALDLDDIIQRSNVLILTETHTTNEQDIDIPNFNCILANLHLSFTT